MGRDSGEKKIVDGRGRKSTISWRSGAGWDHGTGREQVGRIHSGRIGRGHSQEMGREHSRESVGNEVGSWPGHAIQNGWERDRGRGLDTTVGKRKMIRSVFVDLFAKNEISSPIVL